MVTSKKIISELMTQKVQEYINKGYIFNLNTMRGSDGTERVDLIKGNDFIRIYCQRKSLRQYDTNNELYTKYYYSDDVYVVTIGNTKLKNKKTDIVWSSKLNPIHEDIFYEIGHRHGDGGITTDMNDVIHYCEVNDSRLEKRKPNNSKIYRDKDRLAIGYKVVKKQPKTKSIKPNHIQYVEKDGNRYYVHYVTPSGKTDFVRIR